MLIIAVINNVIWAVTKCSGLNGIRTQFSRYRCSTLPVEPSSHLRAGHNVSSVFILSVIHYVHYKNSFNVIGSSTSMKESRKTLYFSLDCLFRIVKKFVTEVYIRKYCIKSQFVLATFRKHFADSLFFDKTIRGRFIQLSDGGSVAQWLGRLPWDPGIPGSRPNLFQVVPCSTSQLHL